MEDDYYNPNYRSTKIKEVISRMNVALSAYYQHFTPLSVEVENVESGK